MLGIEEPLTSLPSVTTAIVFMRSGVSPASPRIVDNAMEKQLA